jgi:CHRD domain-containing protein
MRKVVLALMVVIGAASTLVIASFATAGDGSHRFKAPGGLIGYQEVPAISTMGNGSFQAKISDDNTSFDWSLSYDALQGTVTQAHIHFGQTSVSGGISIWLCGTPAPGPTGPPGTKTCPSPSGTVTGTATAANVVGPGRSVSPTGTVTVGQGIEPGEFNEILAAIRAGKAYANVHTSLWPAGEIRGQLSGRGGDENDDEGDNND